MYEASSSSDFTTYVSLMGIELLCVEKANPR